ncbi:hypothetical protein DFH07DRAFT_783144 [Mycena maculata]|uniref:Uncharacterized protein n=1 Tax=Mycena maculata TaxID=230809 RepID=A0AAD7HP54_9AGAR|nr:hypothetical protein DFH07DRAFT_783144 [Mycena maculata]
MPRGRPRLDPEIKEQRLQESRKRYEQKNLDKRREGAKLRMQRKRATIAASDWRTKFEYHNNAAANSANYRERRRIQEIEERRATSAMKKRARKREEEDVRRKHNPAAKPQPISNAKFLPPPAKPPHQHRPSSPITSTPVPRRKRHLVAEDLNDNPAEEGSDEDGAHHPIEALIWPNRTPQPKRCPYCFEEHCIGMRHPGPYYAVVCKEWRGCVTSKDSRDRMLTQYPHASTWEAPSWPKFDRMWTHDCTEYHCHEGEHTPPGPFVPLTPESSPPSSPSTLSASILSRAPSPARSHLALSLRERQILRNAEHYQFLVAEDARIAANKKGDQKLTDEQLTDLAALRPPPVPISPERLRQQFTRVLGSTFIEHSHQRSCQLAHTEVVINDEEDAEPPALEPPVMYAVSGKNRVFQDRRRAMAAFKGASGADLIFTRDEDELFGFLAEDVAGKMKI